MGDQQPGEGPQPVTVHRVIELLEFTCPCCRERLMFLRDESGARVVPRSSIPRAGDDPE